MEAIGGALDIMSGESVGGSVGRDGWHRMEVWSATFACSPGPG